MLPLLCLFRRGRAGAGCALHGCRSSVAFLPVGSRAISNRSHDDNDDGVVVPYLPLSFSVHQTNLRRRTCFRGGGSANDEGDEGRKPKTGWNHNQPDDSSGFWEQEGTNGASKVSKEEESSKSESGANEPRTGWLHNTTPSKAAQEETKKKSEETSKARKMLQQAMRQQEQNHRMISPPSFHACGEGRFLVVTEHMMSVPLYYDLPRSPRIDVYFSVVERANDDNQLWLRELTSLSPKQRAQQYIQRIGLDNADDMILYLQGGPGFGSPIPCVTLGFSAGSSWAAAALDRYSRVVLMDQRGTGRSTTITKQTLETKYPDLFLLDKDQEVASTAKSIEDFRSTHPEETGRVEKAIQETTEYMAQFRADNIVRDAEEIKEVLMAPTEEPVTEARPWGAALGQSFGGFCMMSYLSLIANPPRICLLTGGIAPMLTPVFEAYTSLWGRVGVRSLKYYEMYPGDIPVVKKIVRKLLKEPVQLPSGGLLTARRFLQLGLGFGGSPSTFASFHSTLSTAMVSSDGTDSDFTRAFLKSMDSAQSFDDHPIYFWLHESIYGDGPNNNSPTAWAAHRAYKKLLEESKEYNYLSTSASDDDTQPTLFFGEMVFPWMPEDFQELSGIGLQAVANALASKTDWGCLYDADHMRKVLGDGSCRAAAAVYYDDMYVDFNASMKVASHGGPLEKCKVWVTNEYQHSGLRDGGSSIFCKLHGMATGEIRTPS